MREDKQFIDGLIVGAMLFAFVVGSAMLYAIRPSTPPLPLPRAWAKRPQQGFGQKSAAPAYASVDLGVGDIVYLEQKPYRVAAAVLHPQQDLVFRALVAAGQGGECVNSADTVLFTLWQRDGQQLTSSGQQVFSEEAREGCLTLQSWSAANSLVFSQTQTGNAAAFQRVWIYDLRSNKLAPAYQYEVIADETRQFVSHIWSSDGKSFWQKTNLITGETSGVYRGERGIKTDPQEFANEEVAFATESLARTDLLSEVNLRSYGQGLELIINGKTVFLSWTQQ